VIGAAPLVVGESGGASLLTVVATIIGVGVLSQVLADRLQVPSVVFLIAAGLVLGPGLGVLKPDQLFGSEPIATIVGVSVAIIVFEGAFNLRVSKLREAPSETVRLITVGAVIAFLGTAAAVHFVLGAGWPLSLLIGALLVATGPTVVTPILEVVPVRDRVAAALETEGIVNDVTAAIGAVVAFEAILLDDPTLVDVARLFAERLGIGVLVGIIVAGVLYYLLQYIDLSPGSAPQNARLLVLAGAVVAFGAAQELASEAGVAAAATAGIVLGNLDVPYDHQIEAFNGDLTLLVLSFVFITLAALLDLQSLSELGAGGPIVVVVAALVLRPLLVFLSTIGDRYATSEKLFISLVGPRGIIPASVATLFALELQPQNATAATTLVGTVFLVILATVVFEGGLARHIAQALDVIPQRTIIVGGGRIGRALAERLEDRGQAVLVIEQDEETVEDLRQRGFTVRQGDGSDREVLEAAGIANAGVVAAATRDDDVNLLVGQLARNTFDVETVVARVTKPDNVDAFEDLDIEAISSPMSVAQSMDNVIERPAISRWMSELDRTGDVQEVEVTNEDQVGMTVSELTEDLPDDVHLALISRDSTNRLPEADDVIEKGDHLTFIGRKEAVLEAIEYYNN